MNFVLVNGRTPRPESFCALCCDAIGETYPRELRTRLSYCSYEYYLGHCKLAMRGLRIGRGHHDQPRPCAGCSAVPPSL